MKNEDTIMPSLLVFALVAFILLSACSTVALWDIEEQIQQNNTYCEMVSLGKKTNYQLGWADYNGNYNEVCRKVTM